MRKKKKKKFRGGGVKTHFQRAEGWCGKRMVTDLEIGVGGHTSTFDGYSDLSDASLILLRQHQGVGEVEGAREFQRTKKRERERESSSSSCPFRVSLAREREREKRAD